MPDVSAPTPPPEPPQPGPEAPLPGAVESTAEAPSPAAAGSGTRSPSSAARQPVTLADALETDGVRRVVATVSYLFCLVAALAAFGVLSSGSQPLTSVLTSSASLLAPSSQAHRVWWVVMLGLAAAVGWLWLPGTLEPRSRALAYPTAMTMALLGVWFFVARNDEPIGGAVVSALLLVALMMTLRVAGQVPSRSVLGRQCGQFGLAVALGWVAVVTADMIATALASHHVPAYFVSAETWGIMGTTALFAAGMALLRYLPGRLYIAGAFSWGFVWIAYARVLGRPRSYFIGAVALVCALLILIAGIAVFLWARGRVRERVA